MRRILIALALLICALPAAAATPVAPTIDYPTAGLTGVWWRPVIFFGHCTYSPASTLTCANADVVIATDSGFSDIVWASYNDLGDYLSMPVDEDHGVFGGSLAGETQLTAGATYFAKVRQQGRMLTDADSDGQVDDSVPDPSGWGSYSATVSFTARVAYAGTLFYVRTDGNDTRCTGLVDAVDTGSGSSQPCGWKTLDKALTTVPSGSRVMLKIGTFSPTIVATYSTNRIEIFGESRTGTILKSNATLPVGTNTNWITFTGDDLYIHDLTFAGRDCPATGVSHEYLKFGSAPSDPPQRLVAERITEGCSAGMWMESGLTTPARGVIFRDWKMLGQLELSGTSQALDLTALDYFAWIVGDIGSYYNIQSSNQPMGTGFHMEDLYWHNSGNHTFESRGADEITWIRPRWKACAANFGEGIRATCQNSGATPRIMGKGISIINAAGDDQTFYNTDNCTTGGAASNYDVGYFSRVNSIADDSDPRTTATGATSGLYMDAGSGGGNVITSTTQFHSAFNLYRDQRGKPIIIAFRPSTGAAATVGASTGSLTTWKDTPFFSGSAYRPDQGSIYSTIPPLVNTQGGNYSPAAGSLAIDAGDPNIRVPAGGGPRIDIGAVESTGGPALPTLSIGDVVVNEAAGTMNFPVTLSVASGQVTNFQFRTEDVSALAGSDYTATAGTEFILGSTNEPHSLSRSHSRKIAYDSVGARWYIVWLTGGGTGIVSYAYSSDGIHYTVGGAIADGQGIGSTSINGQFIAGVFFLTRRGSTAGGTLQDAMFVERYSVGATGALTLLQSSSPHYCGPGSTASLSSCGAATGAFEPIFYGDSLVDSNGYFWLAGHRGQDTAGKHVEVIRSTLPNDISHWGAPTGPRPNGCDGSVPGDCNTFWVVPSGSGISWCQGESGTTLFNMGVGGIGLEANDRGTAGVACNGQMLWTKNATGSATGWAAWSQLTNLLNQWPNALASVEDPTSRLDDRRDSCVWDPNSSRLQCVYIGRDTATTANANMWSFVYNPATSSKTSDVLIVGPSIEVEGVQLAIDPRTSPSKVGVLWDERNTVGGGFTLKSMWGTSCTTTCTWPSSSTALAVSSPTGGRQYPQWPELVESDTYIDCSQVNAGSNLWNIVCGSFTLTQGTGAAGFIAAGATSATVSVPITDDASPEAAETLRLRILNASSNVTVLDGIATGTITDNDTPVPPPTVSFELGAQTQSEATTALSVRVVLSFATASGTNVSVPFTLSGTATAGASCSGGVDYITPTSPITITGGAGTLIGTLSITGCNDATDETPPGAETIILTMGSPTNATQGATTVHTLTVQDNDDVAVTVLTISDVTVNEEAGTATFHVLLTPAAAGTVTVLATTADNTATQPSDYIALSQLLTFVATDTSEDFVVTIPDDALHEPDESFFVNLSAATGGATLGDSQAVGTILESDVPQGGGTTVSDVILGDVIIDGGSPGLPPVAPTIRPIGTASPDTGSDPTVLALALVTCSPLFTGSVCYDVTISGGQGKTNPIGSIVANLRVRQRDVGQPDNGTVIFHAGGAGAGKFDAIGTVAQQISILLAQAGFRTVMVGWGTGVGAPAAGWTQTSAGNLDGHARLAYRIATINDWVYRRIADVDDNGVVEGAFCGAGNSIGATAMAEVCQQYGQCKHETGRVHFDFVALGSGPVMTRLNEGCLDVSLAGATPPESDFGYPPPPTGKELINGTFNNSGSSGPCDPYDAAVAADFIADEQRSPDQEWTFLSTQFVGLRGGNDSPAAGGCTGGNCTNAPNHQAEWFAILSLTSSLVSGPTTVSGADHTIQAVTQGRLAYINAIRDPVTGCKVRP